MVDEIQLQQTKIERDEVKRAIEALDWWFNERRTALRSLEQYIQWGLQTGWITERRKEDINPKCFSSRAVVTLQTDINQFSRTLMLMNLRRTQLQKRLAEIDKILAGSDAA